MEGKAGERERGGGLTSSYDRQIEVAHLTKRCFCAFCFGVVRLSMYHVFLSLERG